MEEEGAWWEEGGTSRDWDAREVLGGRVELCRASLVRCARENVYRIDWYAEEKRGGFKAELARRLHRRRERVFEGVNTVEAVRGDEPKEYRAREKGNRYVW